MNAAAKHARQSTAEVEAAIAKLCELFPPASTVYCVLRYTSRDGKRRAIDMYAICDNRPVKVSALVATVLELPRNKDGACIVSGWGDDAAWLVCHQLSFKLHGMLGK